MRWSISALLLLIAIVACAAGLFNSFWDSTHPNHPLLLGAYLVLNSVSTVAAVTGPKALRSAFTAGSIFGTLYLITVLHCGIGLETIHDSLWLAKNTKLGIVLYVITFLATLLVRMVSNINDAA